MEPELFEFHLAALLGLLFPFAAFLVFFLVGNAGPSVFELYLRTKRPSLAEVISKIDDGMGYVESPVAGIVLMRLGLTVSAYVVAKEIAGEVGFTISSHAEARYFLLLLCAVGTALLSMSCQARCHDQ